MNDDLVVGILTSTNQFLQITNPLPLEDTVGDNLRKLSGSDYIISENEIDSSSYSGEKDTERIEYIKKIKMETALYNSFRNTIRILLNDYKNISIRMKIENELSKKYTPYIVKMSLVMEMLKLVVGNHVSFLDEFDFKSLNNNSTTCINNSEEKCREKTPLCITMIDSVDTELNDKKKTTTTTCQLSLPKTNLISKIDNEIFYFTKMTDELIRYKRIQLFIFTPQSYLSFDKIQYNIQEDEIIILQSLLMSNDYFDNLIEYKKNYYDTYNNFETANPSLTQYYSNTKSIENLVDMDDNDEDQENKPCAKRSIENIRAIFWRNAFHTGMKTTKNNYLYKELVYGNTVSCTFSFIIDIIRKTKNKILTMDDIRGELIGFYNNQNEINRGIIIDIFIKQGKKTLGDQLKSGSINFKTCILSEMYFLTNIDYMFFLEKYEIPSLFISSHHLFENNFNNVPFYPVYTKENENNEENNNYVFIVTSPFRPEHIPKYKIIIPSENEDEIYINLRRVDEKIANEILDTIKTTSSSPDTSLPRQPLTSFLNFYSRTNEKVGRKKDKEDGETTIIMVKRKNKTKKVNKKDVVLKQNKTKKQNAVLMNVDIPEIVEGRINKPQSSPSIKNVKTKPKNKTVKLKKPLKKITIIE
jgi:hypothetical protein